MDALNRVSRPGLATVCAWLVGLGWMAGGVVGQVPAFVEARVTGYPGAPGTVGHPRHLFAEWLTTGGAGPDDSFRHASEVSADLRIGRLEGRLEVRRPGLPPAASVTEFTSHFQPRYRVEAAPGNTANEVIPVEWEVLLDRALFNYTEVASGTDDVASVEFRVTLSLQVAGQGIESQAVYAYTARAQGTAPAMTWSAERSFRTLTAHTVRTEYVTHPVTGEIVEERHIATAGAREAEIAHPPDPADDHSFRKVRLRVRHAVRPGNGLAFFIWLRVEAVGRVAGAGLAADWRQFDLRYRLPEGYVLKATDGQDLTGMKAGSLPAPPAGFLPITGWNPPVAGTSGPLTFSFEPPAGLATELQRTFDLRDWTTVRRIDPGPGGVPVVVEVPAVGDSDGLRPGAGFYRVVLPGE